MIEFSILPGLPGTGPYPEQFPPQNRQAHREGVVVRFCPPGEPSWVGNFQPGLSHVTEVRPHPNGRDVLIIAQGCGYVVDPATRELRESLGVAIIEVIEHPLAHGLILDHQGIQYEAVGPAGTLWETRRLSYDGFRAVRIEGAILRGEGWRPHGPKEWLPFEVDLRTGRARGGAYETTTDWR